MVAPLQVAGVASRNFPTVTVPVQYRTQAAPVAPPVIDPCQRRNPTISISPATQSGPAGTARTYTVAIRNNNVNCPAATYALNATLPRGFTLNRSTASVTLASGASTNQAFILTPTNQATAGVHPLNITVREPVANFTGLLTARHTVLPPVLENRTRVFTGRQLHSTGGVTLGDALILSRNANQFGPYVELRAGWHRVTYTGTNLSVNDTMQAYQWRSAVNGGTLFFQRTNVSVNNNGTSLTYTVNIPANHPGVEFAYRNTRATNVTITRMTIEPINAPPIQVR